QATNSLRKHVREKGLVRLVAATGASQFEFLEVLTNTPDIDWGRVELFHLDEYVGLSDSHPASFRKYITERIIDKTGIKYYHLLDGSKDPSEAAREASEAIAKGPIDLLFAGIGENGHLAFNDPPANFKIDDPYIVVDLDEACRRQQVGEGWFPSFA